MRQVREEAYGQDIGQHSWVTVEELTEDILRLKLSRNSHLLDLGCGPCGPLAFILTSAGCRGIGLDLSEHAIAAGRARMASVDAGKSLVLHAADLNQPLQFASASFDAVICLDVILHLRDRGNVFREVARVLRSGGRFLFTDAGVLTGAISDEEVRQRSVHGYTQFVPPGFNERTLASAGLRLLEGEDRTASLLKNAGGRLAARIAHRTEIEQTEGTLDFERQQAYLETVVGLSERGTLSRMMYLTELA